MKQIKNTFILLFSILMLSSCTTDETTVAAIEQESGVLLNINTNSSGSFLGSPQSGVPLADAEVTVSEASATLFVKKVSGTTKGIEKFELVKSFNGGAEILVAESTTLPMTVSLNSISDFLDGTGMTATDLRIGDVIEFTVKATQTDGDVVYYTQGTGTYRLTLNCSYDLNGTYTMTNSVCGISETVTISQNSDGTWHASTGDGGLLQFCSSNTSLVNGGDFAVSCGGIVEASQNVDFCGGYGIGCIIGGTWDGTTLSLEHTNDFFTWADATYTSTYVRQ